MRGRKGVSGTNQIARTTLPDVDHPFSAKDVSGLRQKLNLISFATQHGVTRIQDA